ncbi:hypothetical protein LTV02_30325 [Nocardia yamanashiensis]|uniref:hypothetical protein n=1 Tax=Nocardia yamanashiensis TaxID=209247 RepID=UPI001E367A5E|nr:hypothetical protein [Nocardia yamanashiensis]UGT40292.1 hypothetical protein LTV02_30325 [Nocardia yamanashiensis]
MKMRKFAGIAALLVTAIGVTTGAAGTAGAAPAAADNGVVNYAATQSENGQVVIRTDAGSLVNEDGVFKIKAANGATIAGTELKFRVDDFEFPIAAEIAGNTATLTPAFDEAHAVYKPVALPYENQAPWKTEYDREVAAWTRLTQTITLGATIGTLVGGIGGAGLGCIAGAALGAVATGALATLFGLGPIGGCIAGAAAVGFLGTVAGQIFVTAPVAIAAAVQYFTTINQPFTAPAK